MFSAVMSRPHAASLRKGLGFTVIELVMVLVLVGVLAVFALPRVLDTGALDARGFHDQTLGLLRYAHKAAIAQRRTVCVAFTTTTATLRIDADRDGATGGNGCEADLMGPRGDVPGQAVAPSPVQYSVAPGAVVFDGLGKPGGEQSIQVAGVTAAITVEGATGYVHD